MDSGAVQAELSPSPNTKRITDKGFWKMNINFHSQTYTKIIVGGPIPKTFSLYSVHLRSSVIGINGPVASLLIRWSSIVHCVQHH